MKSSGNVYGENVICSGKMTTDYRIAGGWLMFSSFADLCSLVMLNGLSRLACVQ